MRARITITDSEVEVDLSECADQVRWPFNVPFASTQSGTLTLFVTFLGWHAITNAGTYRPFRIVTRKGSIVDPLHPAPVRGCMTGVYRMATAIKRALGDATPERTAAAGCDSTLTVTRSRRGLKGYEMFTEILAGGNSGACGYDGAEAIPQILSNTGNAQVEAIERSHEFVRVLEYALIADSAGAGEFRGGVGVRKCFEVLADDVLLSTNGDRHQSSPWGLDGGGEGSRTAYRIHRREGGAVEVIDASGLHTMNHGDVFEMIIPGGGGWGVSSARDPARVLTDVRNVRVSEAAARETSPHAFAALAAAQRLM
jgi:N-methylhydantoinase B